MALNIPKVLDTNIFPTSRASAEGAGSGEDQRQKIKNEDVKLVEGDGITITPNEDENEIEISNSRTGVEDEIAGSSFIGTLNAGAKSEIKLNHNLSRRPDSISVTGQNVSDGQVINAYIVHSTSSETKLGLYNFSSGINLASVSMYYSLIWYS